MRKGSRTYSTFTYHYQRNPRECLVDSHTTYRKAQAFIGKWEQLYKEWLQSYKEKEELLKTAEVIRTRARVEVRATGYAIMASYFQEEKDAKDQG